jgi:hypothetical protein
MQKQENLWLVRSVIMKFSGILESKMKNNFVHIMCKCNMLKYQVVSEQRSLIER